MEEITIAVFHVALGRCGVGDQHSVLGELDMVVFDDAGGDIT